MVRSMFRTGCSFLLCAFLLTTASTAAAQTPVVSFGGSSSTGLTISGYIDYDQGKAPTSTGSGDFSFTGDKVDTYGAYYLITGGASPITVSKQGAQWSTYTINTLSSTMKNFVVTGTFTGTSMSITLYTNTSLSARSLPAYSAFTTTPPTTGTFTQTVDGVATTFYIAVTASTDNAKLLSQAPTRHVVYACPHPSAVYVCQPRPACCLSRLFCRRGCR